VAITSRCCCCCCWVTLNCFRVALQFSQLCAYCEAVIIRRRESLLIIDRHYSRNLIFIDPNRACYSSNSTLLRLVVHLLYNMLYSNYQRTESPKPTMNPRHLAMSNCCTTCLTSLQQIKEVELGFILSTADIANVPLKLTRSVILTSQNFPPDVKAYIT